MGLTLLGKASGLLRDIVVASHFGTSSGMDAFLVATTISGVMFVWFKAPIRVVFIPLFAEELSTRGEPAAWKHASTLINTSVLFVLMAAGLGWLLSPYLVHLVAPGFADDTKALSVGLTRIMMSAFALLILGKILSALFHSYQRFGRPGMLHTVDNVVVIPAIILLAPMVGIYGLVMATIVGTVAQVLIQLPILWKHRAHYTLGIDLKSPTIRRMLWMTFPLFVGLGGGQLATIFDRIFASLLQPGSLSALSYGHRLTYASFELLVTSLTTVLFPFFSRLAGVEAYADLGRKLFKCLKTVFWIVLPTSMGLLVLHEPLVRLVYERGAFGEESVRLTAQAVLFYAIGLSAYSVASVVTFAFYSVKDIKTPVTVGLVRIGVKILLSFALVGAMAHSGLALAESLSFVLKAGLLLLLLPEELRQPEYRQVLRSFGVTAVLAAAMGGVVFLVLPIFEGLAEGSSPIGTSMVLAGSITIGAATYFVSSLFLQRAEVDGLYRFVRSGFAKR
jgi:putative peptidoglycan lipid II flippase